VLICVRHDLVSLAYGCLSKVGWLFGLRLQIGIMSASAWRQGVVGVGLVGTCFGRRSRTNLPKGSSSGRVGCEVFVLLLPPGSLRLRFFRYSSSGLVENEGNVGAFLKFNLVPDHHEKAFVLKLYSCMSSSVECGAWTMARVQVALQFKRRWYDANMCT
jgi:hypothetical protein